jgi:hypothetical protein
MDNRELLDYIRTGLFVIAVAAIIILTLETVKINRLLLASYRETENEDEQDQSTE